MAVTCWVYMTVVMPPHPKQRKMSVVVFLNQYGALGWELCGLDPDWYDEHDVRGSLCVFKRPERMLDPSDKEQL